MSQMMINAAVAMNQLQSKIDVVGNNMANSQTTGYKSRSTEFSSLLNQQVDNLTDPANALNRQTPDGIRVGSGARLGSINLEMSQGSLRETGRQLDAALTADNHLFSVQATGEDGAGETLYTRDGAFFLSPVNGNTGLMLTTANGNPVLGDGNPIVLENGFDDISIRENGEIVVTRAGAQAVEGQLDIVEAVRPQLLEAEGQNMFRLPDAALGFDPAEVIIAADGQEAVLKPGALEQSNVDVAKQMSDLMLAQRSYQFNARSISMGDQMEGLVNQLRS